MQKKCVYTIFLSTLTLNSKLFRIFASVMEQKKITFDSFIRSVIAVIIVVGIVMLLNRLSSVLLPFFLAWLISYLLFPLVKFFQYRCHLKFRIVGIFCAFLVVGIVLTGLCWVMIPPMLEEGLRVKDMLVDIGEIFCDGRNPSGQPWSVGVDRPVDGNQEKGAELSGIWSSGSRLQATTLTRRMRRSGSIIRSKSSIITSMMAFVPLVQ